LKGSMIVLLLEESKPAIIAEIQAFPNEDNPNITILRVDLGEPPYLQKRNQKFFDSATRSNYCAEVVGEIADQAIPSHLW
jgi:hypothetical protein